jgi:aspartyl-tRNA synthetase
MYGTIQLVFDYSNATEDQVQKLNELSLETVLSVSGTVRERPADMVNKTMKSGGIYLFRGNRYNLQRYRGACR